MIQALARRRDVIGVGKGANPPRPLSARRLGPLANAWITRARYARRVMTNREVVITRRSPGNPARRLGPPLTPWSNACVRPRARYARRVMTIKGVVVTLVAKMLRVIQAGIIVGVLLEKLLYRLGLEHFHLHSMMKMPHVRLWMPMG